MRVNAHKPASVRYSKKRERAVLLFLKVAGLEDPDWWENIQVTDCNQAAEELFGFERKELQHPALILDSSFQDTWQQTLQEFLQSDKRTVDFPAFYQKKNGEKLTGNSVFEKIQLQGNDDFSLICLQFSPETHAVAQVVGSDSHLQLQTALVHSHLLAVTTDEEGKITFCNNAFLDVTETEAQDLIGENLFEELVPVRGGKMDIRKFLKLTTERGFTENIKRSIKTKSGKTLDLNLISIVLHHDGQQFIGITILAEDITEQKQVRKRLQETNLQMAELLNNAFDLIQIFNENGNLLFVNNAWREVLGYHEVEIKLMNFFDLVHPQYLSVTRSMLQRVKEEESRRKFKTVLIAKDGDHVYVSGSISWKYRSERPGEFRIIFHDISDQIKAERAQRLYNSITDLTLQSPDLDHLYFNIHRELKKVMEADNFYIALTEEKKELSFPYYTAGSGPDLPVKQDLEAEKDLVDYVIATNHALILKEEDFLELITANIIRPRDMIPQIWLGVPLTVNKRVIGLIVVQNFDKRNAVDEKDLDLLNFVSGQVALAIERKRNEEKLNEQTSRLNAIFESSSHLIWSVDRKIQVDFFQSELCGGDAESLSY